MGLVQLKQEDFSDRSQGVGHMKEGQSVIANLIHWFNMWADYNVCCQNRKRFPNQPCNYNEIRRNSWKLLRLCAGDSKIRMKTPRLLQMSSPFGVRICENNNSLAWKCRDFCMVAAFVLLSRGLIDPALTFWFFRVFFESIHVDRENIRHDWANLRPNTADTYDKLW